MIVCFAWHIHSPEFDPQHYIKSNTKLYGGTCLQSHHLEVEARSGFQGCEFEVSLVYMRSSFKKTTTAIL